MNRRRVRAPGYVEDVAHDLLVAPAGRKLGLAGIADSVSMSAAGRVAVEYVRGAFGTDADLVQRRGGGGGPRGPPRPRRSCFVPGPGGLLRAPPPRPPAPRRRR